MKTKQKYNFNDRKEYIDQDVLESAPQGKGKTPIQFFKLGKSVTDTELELEYTNRKLTPATIEDLCFYDKENSQEVDNMKYVATHWKDAQGKWCYAAFPRWDDGERGVFVHRFDYDWSVYWWFCGLASPSPSDSKPSPESLSSLPLDWSLIGKVYRNEEGEIKIKLD